VQTKRTGGALLSTVSFVQVVAIGLSLIAVAVLVFLIPATLGEKEEGPQDGMGAFENDL
jgi:hypothetical protein